MGTLVLPIEDGKLSWYFVRCSYYYFCEIKSTCTKSSLVKAPHFSSKEQIPEWLSKNNATDAVAHIIDKDLMTLFQHYKIQLYVGIKLNQPKQIVDEFLNGSLYSDNRIIWEITKKRK